MKMNEELEKNYAESEQRYRELADMLAEGIFESDLGGTVTYANRKALTSLGLHEDDLTLESMIRRADQALYTAKRTGRNRVVEG